MKLMFALIATLDMIWLMENVLSLAIRTLTSALNAIFIIQIVANNAPNYIRTNKDAHAIDHAIFIQIIVIYALKETLILVNSVRLVMSKSMWAVEFTSVILIVQLI